MIAAAAADTKYPSWEVIYKVRRLLPLLGTSWAASDAAGAMCMLRNKGDFFPILCNPASSALQDLTSAGMPSLTPEEVRTATEFGACCCTVSRVQCWRRPECAALQADALPGRGCLPRALQTDPAASWCRLSVAAACSPTWYHIRTCMQAFDEVELGRAVLIDVRPPEDHEKVGGWVLR